MKDHHDPQLKTIRRVLSELSEVAEHASLTGSLASGVRQAAQSYNGALAYLTSHGSVPEGMFEPLDLEQADYGQIGVQSRLLLAATNSDRREREGGYEEVIALAPFLKAQDLAELVRERIGDASLSTGLLAGLAPFLDSETLGGLVRRRLDRPTPPQPKPQAPVPPTPAAPPAPATWNIHPVPVEDLTPEPQTSPPETLESLAAELRKPGLSTEDRQRIATRLAEIAYEQASTALE